MKTFMLVCALVAGLAMGVPAQTHGTRLGEEVPKTAPEPTADYIAIYQDARAAYNADKLDEAEAQVQVVLAKYPHYSPAVSLLTMITRQRQTDPSAALRRKLDSIQIPRVNFHDALVESTLDFLRDETRRLDPEKKGINLVPALPDEIKKRRITLDLVDVSAADLLKYLAEVGGFRYRIQRSAILIYAPEAAKPTTAAPPSAPTESPPSSGPAIPGAGP